jgi:hypothetical protein
MKVNYVRFDMLSMTIHCPERMCPSCHMGDLTVWASIASLLAVFDFKKAMDVQGNEIDMTPMFSGSSIRQAIF